MPIPSASEVIAARSNLPNGDAFLLKERERIGAALEASLEEAKKQSWISTVTLDIPYSMRYLSLAVVEELLAGKGYTWTYAQDEGEVTITW